MIDVDKAGKALAHDFAIYAPKVLRTHKDGKKVPLELYRFQVWLWGKILASLLAGKPIRVMVLKARQIGISTFFLGLIYWFITMNRYRGAFIVAQRIKESNQLFERLKTFYNSCPAQFRPDKKIFNRELIHFAADKDDSGLESKATVDSAENQDLGASFSIQYALLDEFARWERYCPDVKTALTSISNAIGRKPGTGIFIVSTGQPGSYFQEMWEDPDNNYEKLFIPFVAEETYRITLEMGAYFELHISEKQQFGNEPEAADIMRALLLEWYPELDFEHNPIALEHRIFECLAWRRETIKSECGNDWRIFHQEFPLTAAQAFLKAGEAMFDQHKLASQDERIKKAAIVPITCGFDRDAYHENAPKDWWRSAFFEDALGHFTIYEDPILGAEYVIGADPSEGYEDSDCAAAEIMKVEFSDSGLQHLTEVGVWDEPIEPDYFADLLVAAGTIYNNALLIWEVNGPGKATTLRLIRSHYYSNLYWRKVFDDKVTDKRDKRWGWHSNIDTKERALLNHRALIRDNLIHFNHLGTIKQHRGYKRAVNRNDLLKSGSRNDNIVVASALAGMGAKEIYRFRPQKKVVNEYTYSWVLEMDRRAKEQKANPFANRSYPQHNRY